MHSRSFIPIAICLASSGTRALAQAGVVADRSGVRATLPIAEEIALARSAAPKDVSAHATVLVFTGTGYVVAVQGSSGTTCAVLRSWPKSLEPQCFDVEASTTILPILLREAELQILGKAPAEIEGDREEGIRAGQYRLPSRPAMSYMLSSAQELYSDDGQRVGRWKPHLMIYFPYLQNTDLGLDSTGRVGRLMLFDAGKPLSTLVIIQDVFVTPDSPASASP